MPTATHFVRLIRQQQWLRAQPTRLDQYLATLSRLNLIRSAQSWRALFADVFGGVELKGRRVLDIGGGSGIYSFYAAVMGARQVVCLEPEAAGSSRGVTRKFDLMREALPEMPVRLEAQTVQQYQAPGKFDVILMNASINHIDEDGCIRLVEDAQARARFRQVFAHIATLARPAGRLIVVDCTRHNFFPAVGWKNPFIPAIEWHKHQAPEVWARLLEESGFRSPRVRWQPLFRFGKLGQVLTANKAAAYFLKGMFRLEMQRA